MPKIVVAVNARKKRKYKTIYDSNVSQMSALLKNPETLETILATTPALAHDPVALCKYTTILRNFFSDAVNPNSNYIQK